ncbi:hypothetical protein AM588_10008905 [Phytophthora nicotianae]|uniref:DDE-1 domain-containing protein n=1 Tax=Phytophthora nicotianae TaxID=4792 RepID=A0A0W8DF02_PHYNI|nr:hypothetical protein AM588_10008905 [Phytophthora nicotianae]
MDGDGLTRCSSCCHLQWPERLSKRAAERVFGVSAKAIGRYLAGQQIGVKPGRTSALRDVEEDALVEGLLDRARRGFPATRLHLKAIVLDAISDGRAHQFGPYGPSTKWISSFLSRHSTRLTVRKARILDSARVNATERSEIEYFFAEYSDFIKNHPITPAQIYNCDETGVDPQGGAPKKVITKKGAKSVAVQIGQDRENTTVLSAISATGALIPPLFIFKGVGFPSDFLNGAPPGSKGTSTPSAFIDSDIFEEWIDHFIEHIPASRPVLLILDNHASHVGYLFDGNVFLMESIF